MKRNCAIAISLLILAALFLTAQTNSSLGWKVKPQIITVSTAVDVCTLTGGPRCGKDVYLCWMDASTASTATSFTLTDQQSPTPVSRPTSVAIAANSWYLVGLQASSSCSWYPGGLKITVANANALTVQMSGRYDP